LESKAIDLNLASVQAAMRSFHEPQSIISVTKSFSAAPFGLLAHSSVTVCDKLTNNAQLAIKAPELHHI